MSTLWTPSGEHPIPRKPEDEPGPGAEPGTSPTAQQARRAPDQAPAGRPGRSRPASEEIWEPGSEDARLAQAEMDAVREQLLGAPVELVIANHAMGLWELAALHLSENPPHLADAQLAIDGLSALVEGLQGRLGEPERTLVGGLAELRMAFVQLHSAERARQASSASPGPP